MKNLKQNNLESATTDLGFVKAMNENIGEGTVKLIREVELETGEKVQVEGVTPHGMKKILNMVADNIEFVTPGEDYDINGTGEDTLSGIVKSYNTGVVALTPDTTSLEGEGDSEDPDESTGEEDTTDPDESTGEGDSEDPDESTGEGDSEDPENPDGENTDNNEDTTEE